jgi:hypothetical protein
MRLYSTQFMSHNWESQANHRYYSRRPHYRPCILHTVHCCSKGTEILKYSYLWNISEILINTLWNTHISMLECAFYPHCVHSDIDRTLTCGHVVSKQDWTCVLQGLSKLPYIVPQVHPSLVVLVITKWWWVHLSQSVSTPGGNVPCIVMSGKGYYTTGYMHIHHVHVYTMSENET